jgi:hypothetical protein
MSTSGSRPPAQPQRKLVLRRKVTTEQGSSATSSLATKDVASPSLPPPPTLLPRAHRPIEHPAELDAPPKPVSPGESGVDWRSSSGSKAAALLTSRSGATPVPLPSRVSVPPVVASVPISALQAPAAPVPSRGRGVLLAAGVVVAGALVAAAFLVGAKLQIHPSASATTGPVEVVRVAATSPNGPGAAQPADTHPDRVTSVEDLPRAPVPARPPAAVMPRVPRAPNPSASSTAKPGIENPTEGDVAAASASTGPAASAAPESPSAQVPEVDLPSAPPPPADPLIRAVRQSIDDGTGH